MKIIQRNINKNRLWKRSTITQFCGFVFLTLLAGCSSNGGAPVNLSVAQETIESAMEGWKNGKTPKDLLAESPSIFVQEAEWNDETKLLDYEIVNSDQPAGPNLIATVKLKLGNADGKITEKTATYVVGTSPGLTVYRNTMR